MQGKYIFSALVVILLVCSPVAAKTNKIAAGAPVFIGESGLDITKSIQDCHVIGWWPDEESMTGPATRNLTIKRLNEATDLATNLTVSPGIFRGYTGTWYCEDKIPHYAVLNVIEPRLAIQVWDADSNKDISGQSVPLATKVTYRISTNLNQALSYSNRTDLTPADGFFTVQLTTPQGKQLKTFYTGSIGAADTQYITFDSSPFITAPVYIGRNLESWNRLSRETTGSLIYPAGTYTFTVTQNLNHMQESLSPTGTANLTGITTASADITFLPLEQVTPAATLQPESTITAMETEQPVTTVPELTLVTTVPVAKKTTYSPLPAWIIIVSLGAAGLLVGGKLR